MKSCQFLDIFGKSEFRKNFFDCSSVTLSEIFLATGGGGEVANNNLVKKKKSFQPSSEKKKRFLL